MRCKVAKTIHVTATEKTRNSVRKTTVLRFNFMAVPPGSE